MRRCIVIEGYRHIKVQENYIKEEPWWFILCKYQESFRDAVLTFAAWGTAGHKVLCAPFLFRLPTAQAVRLMQQKTAKQWT